MAEMYRTGWESPVQNTRETGGTDRRIGDIYADRLMRTLGRADLQGTRLLDFGAGRGDFLWSLAAAGAEVVGIDAYGWSYLQNQGLEAYPNTDSLNARDRFDGIVSVDVVEHLVRPWETLRNLKRHLADDGWLYVTTPNVQSAAARLHRTDWKEARKPHHLLFFSPATLEQTLRWAGLEAFQRLRWRVPYARSRPRAILQMALQMAGWDGQLRYLARQGGASAS